MCPPGLLTLFFLSARSHGHAVAHSHAYKAEAYILNILWPVNKRAGQMHHPQQTDFEGWECLHWSCRPLRPQADSGRT